MSSGMADIVDIVSTNTFLCIGDSSVLRCECAIKILLQGGNTGIDPKQSRIVVRNQGSRRLDVMSMVMEEVEPCITDFITCHFSHK